jgi:hypothetical protein
MSEDEKKVEKEITPVSEVKETFAQRMGRPTKYYEGRCDELLELADTGFSLHAAAAKMGVHIDTIYEWINVHPIFSEAVKEFKARSLVKWESYGLEGLFHANFKGDTWKFNMFNRFRDLYTKDGTATQVGMAEKPKVLEINASADTESDDAD